MNIAAYREPPLTLVIVQVVLTAFVVACLGIAVGLCIAVCVL